MKQSLSAHHGRADSISFYLDENEHEEYHDGREQERAEEGEVVAPRRSPEGVDRETHDDQRREDDRFENNLPCTQT